MTPDKTPSESTALSVGYRLGEYTIASVLGHGGFGITYRARDTKLGVDVALKEYFPGVYATRTRASTIVPRPGADLEIYRWGLTEFLKEAQALAKFKHPHIVRVLRFMEANGTAYMIMEYEQGETLSAYLRRHGGVLGEATLLQIFLPVLNGLQAVHDAGLLHLDIKPDNIYLRADGQPMLIDFGSSRLARGDSGSKVTLTPGYCALEQYPGFGDASPTSDVYGMGATIYRCITGKSPIDALARHEAFERTRIDPLPPASSFERPIYSAHIRPCIDLALKLNAAERPASAYALQQGLMGKDVTKMAARAPASPYRPGTGFIGVIPAAVQPKQEDKRRRYSRLEKFIAVSVFIVTFTIITPKILIDTGRMSSDDLYEFVDHTKAFAIATVQDIGAWINEVVFREPPRPKVTPPVRARRTAKPAAIVETRSAPPFAADKDEPPARLTIAGPRPWALGFLQHGAVLAVGTEDGAVKLWDTHTGAVRAVLPARAANPAALAVFASSQWIAIADHEHGIATFDPLGNLDLTLRDEPPHPASAVAVSPSALLLAEAGDDGVINFWDVAQRRKVNSFQAGKPRVQTLAFATDERTLAVGDASGGIGLWSATDATPISQWRAHESGVVALAFSPDGRRLASAGTRGDLRLWSSATANEPWKPGTMLADAPASVNAAAFSPDGHWLIATGSVGSVYVWNAETGQLAHRLTTDARKLHALALTRDGRFIAAVGDDNVVRIWK